MCADIFAFYTLTYMCVRRHASSTLYSSVRDVERSKMLDAGGAGDAKGDREGSGTPAPASAHLSLKQGEKIKISIGGGKVSCALYF